MIPWVLVFRIALILFTLSFRLDNLFNYFLRDYEFFFDAFWLLYIGVVTLGLYVLKSLHLVLKFGIGILNLFWLPFGFWFLFYYNIINDPNGRSLYDMLCNPRLSSTVRTNQHAKKLAKTKMKRKSLRFYNASRLMLSSPQSQGAYAHVDEKQKKLLQKSVIDQLQSKQVYFDDPLRLSIPYEFLSKKQVEPPDGLLFDIILFTSLLVMFIWSILMGYGRLLYVVWRRRLLRWYQKFRGRANKSSKVSKKKGVALTTQLFSK